MPPLLPYALTLIAGILLHGSGISVYFIFIPLSVSAFLIVKRKQTYALFLLSLVFGFVISLLHSPQPLHKTLSSTSHEYSAVVDEIKEYESSRVMILKIDSCGGKPCRPFLIKLFTPSTLPVADETYRVKFNALLSELVSDSEIPDEIDYNKPLLNKGVVAETSVSPDSLYVGKVEKGLLNTIIRFRHDVIRAIALTSLESQTKSFLITTLTGDKSFLTPDTRELFSTTGIAHVLALSGMHVGILAWIISILLFPFRIAGKRNARLYVTIILLWLFAIMTGLSASVVRAVIMATLMMICTVLQRVKSPFNSLSFAAIAILIFTPSAIYTIGFQLSFIAVTAILLMAKDLNPLKSRRGIPYFIGSYVSMAFSAMLGTCIVSAYYFGIFPVYFLITTMVISLLLPFLLGGGIILTLSTALGLTIAPLASGVDLLFHAINGTATFIARLPGAHIDNLHIEPFVLILYFDAIACFVIYLRKRRIVWCLSASSIAAVAIISIVIYTPKPYPDMLFIPKSSGNTTILIKERKNLWMISTAHRVDIDEIKERHERRYSKFMAKCGIDSITQLPYGYESPTLSRHINTLRFYGKNITILGGNTTYGTSLSKASIDNNNEGNGLSADHNSKVDYLLVCRGFSYDITEIAHEMSPDTILLASDIHRVRHDRYAEVLTSSGKKVRSLRKGAFILSAPR